jgi:hypothetical protein
MLSPVMSTCSSSTIRRGPRGGIAFTGLHGDHVSTAMRPKSPPMRLSSSSSSSSFSSCSRRGPLVPVISDAPRVFFFFLSKQSFDAALFHRHRTLSRSSRKLPPSFVDLTNELTEQVHDPMLSHPFFPDHAIRLRACVVPCFLQAAGGAHGDCACHHEGPAAGSH